MTQTKPSNRHLPKSECLYGDCQRKSITFRTIGLSKIADTNLIFISQIIVKAAWLSVIFMQLERERETSSHPLLKLSPCGWIQGFFSIVVVLHLQGTKHRGTVVYGELDTLQPTDWSTFFTLYKNKLMLISDTLAQLTTYFVLLFTMIVIYVLSGITEMFVSLRCDLCNFSVSVIYCVLSSSSLNFLTSQKFQKMLKVN